MPLTEMTCAMCVCAAPAGNRSAFGEGALCVRLVGTIWGSGGRCDEGRWRTSVDVAAGTCAWTTDRVVLRAGGEVTVVMLLCRRGRSCVYTVRNL